jgi:hypothetical protein
MMTGRRKFLSQALFALAGLLFPKSALARKLQPPPSKVPLSAPTRKYVLVSLFESPPRWLFDLVLKPTPDSPMVPHAVIGTEFQRRFESGQPEGALEYKTVDIQGFQFSSIWAKPMPVDGGAWKPMSALLENALIIRGCDMRQDGHPLNSMKLEAAGPDDVSLGGMLAEKSQAYFHALGVSGLQAAREKSLVSAFKTPSGKPAIALRESENPRETYIDQLFAPYLSANRKGVASVTESESFARILREHIRPRLGASRTQEVRQAIRDISKLPLASIVAEYRAAERRYADLVRRSLHESPLEGVNDRPVPGLKLPRTFPVKDRNHVKLDDYIGAYKLDDHYVGNADLRSVFREAVIPSLSHQFALSEMAIKHGLSDVVLFNVDPIQRLVFGESYRKKDVKWEIKGEEITIYHEGGHYRSQGRGETMNVDGHNVGSVIGLLGYSLYFRAVAACLNDFIERLKAMPSASGSMFDETVIHLTAEFERCPRGDLGGTEHGWKGHTSTVLSGRVPKLEVIGNIHASVTEEGWKDRGTWGHGAPLDETGLVISYNDIVCSLADVLEVRTPIQGYKLFGMAPDQTGSGERIVPFIKRARNV